MVDVSRSIFYFFKTWDRIETDPANGIQATLLLIWESVSHMAAEAANILKQERSWKDLKEIVTNGNVIRIEDKTLYAKDYKLLGQR